MKTVTSAETTPHFQIIILNFKGISGNILSNVEYKCTSMYHILCSVFSYDFPRTVASRAILMYMPYSVCLKYAARGSESKDTLKTKSQV